MHVNQNITLNCADLALTNEFTPTWSAEQAYGKQDPIASYSHTGRKMSFNAVLLASNLDQAIVNQNRVDKLIKFQYPKYSATATAPVLSAPPFFKVTAIKGKIYSSVKGFFDSFAAEPGSSSDIVPLVSGDNHFYERRWDINITMTVLHSSLPGWLGRTEPGAGGSFVFTKNPGIEVGRASLTDRDPLADPREAA